jgi:hypothetical protein
MRPREVFDFKSWRFVPSLAEQPQPPLAPATRTRLSWQIVDTWAGERTRSETEDKKKRRLQCDRSIEVPPYGCGCDKALSRNIPLFCRMADRDGLVHSTFLVY